MLCKSGNVARSADLSDSFVNDLHSVISFISAFLFFPSGITGLYNNLFSSEQVCLLYSCGTL